MTIRRAYAAVMAASVSAAGCGTIANVATRDGDAKVPFGGVKHDMAFIRRGAADGGPPGAGHITGTATLILCAADLPFSLVGDVLTWPYTRAYTDINQAMPPASQPVTAPARPTYPEESTAPIPIPAAPVPVSQAPPSR